jgi:hypothetical protein
LFTFLLVAVRIKNYTKNHPRFKALCISIAQSTHRLELNMKMKFLGYKKETIRPLNDAKAVEAGAHFLSEAFLFLVAASAITFETTRQKINNSTKQKLLEERLVQIEQNINQLKELVEIQQQQQSMLMNELSEIRKHIRHK